MKTVVAILLLVIMAFSIMPDTCDDCIKSNVENTSGNTDSHNNNCSDCCSPFQICGTCVGFTVLSHQLLDKADIAYKPYQIIIPDVSDYISEYLGEIWRPPQLA